MVTTGQDARLAAAIGNFDGVHRGHQRLLRETVSFARRIGAKPAVMVFEPHPRRFFRPDDPPFLITTPERRDALLGRHGAAQIITLRFDAALAAMSPEDFVDQILRVQFQLAGVVTGDEFRFGKGRAGNVAMLRAYCAHIGIETLTVTPAGEGEGGEKIGSSAIRSAIAEGEVAAAAAMLGRLWTVDGVVAEGQRLGRTLGFPTANFALGEIIEPRNGVYAVEATIRGQTMPGVANFGRRPTVGAPAPLLETHLFDFDGDLYGETMEVAFIEFIRDERKFDGLPALKAQIAADCRAARRIHEKRG